MSVVRIRAYIRWPGGVSHYQTPQNPQLTPANFDNDLVQRPLSKGLDRAALSLVVVLSVLT